ncbi:transient receptor potential cation channel trpm-like [Macrosteles quadrilineatus]|uniref:transient receptor potential cation channel trpm-like n=1 Tax=Macrosteles quadrilineatus TaxID=74068 RepID=UPI0023E2313D|nr:transient receptor potential cation channel trpm-like [Macrosteles quadrilineatus]
MAIVVILYTVGLLPPHITTPQLSTQLTPTVTQVSEASSEVGEVVVVDDPPIARRQSSAGSVAGVGVAPVTGLPPELLPRQLSQTHSEPEGSTCEPLGAKHVERSVTWAEPRIKVIPPQGPSARSMLMAMHTEYTSITDELETLCGLLSPPRSPRLLSPPRIGETSTSTHRSRHHSEMSNPEMALVWEKEHLKDAEESDYLLMEGLIQTRFQRSDSDDKFHNNAFFLTADHSLDRGQGRPLRRASAIEGDIPTPCLSQAVSLEENITAAGDGAATITGVSDCGAQGELEVPSGSTKLSVESSSIKRLSDSQNSLVPNPETMC